MRVLALFDIHANVEALAAVLADPRAAGPDAVIVGGDAVPGPFAQETLALLDGLAGPVRWIRGNGEREVAETVAATQPVDGASDQTPWITAAAIGAERALALGALPLTVELDGVLYCHASPRRDDEMLTRLSVAERYADALAGVTAPLVVAGHTHQQDDRMVGDVRFVNAGSVGLPYEGDGAARWLWVADGVPALRHTGVRRGGCRRAHPRGVLARRAVGGRGADRAPRGRRHHPDLRGPDGVMTGRAHRESNIALTVVLRPCGTLAGMEHPATHRRAPASAHPTARRMPRGRVRPVIVAIGALLVLGVASATAFAQTSATRLESGIVVIKTKLGYQDISAAGTGMVLTPGGEVLTNNHVIRGATEIRLVVPNTGRTYTAHVVGYDMADDVAVLQAVGARNLSTVTTSSAKLTIGSAVRAIGNAGGTGRLASATGKITRLRSSVLVRDDDGGAVRLTGMIGVNASVVPGDSGGPLMNSSGEVIGMDTAGSAGATFRSTNETQAYAIPITKALSIVRKVDAGTSSTRIHVGGTAFIGVQVGSDFGGRSDGAAIAGVTPGGPAAGAGLVPGDVITAINGYHISSRPSLTSSLLRKKPGDSVTITYSDPAGVSHAVKLVLASGPAQ